MYLYCVSVSSLVIFLFAPPIALTSPLLAVLNTRDNTREQFSQESNPNIRCYSTCCILIAGVTVTPVVYSAQTLTGALIGTCFCSLVAGFAFGFWFSQRLRGSSYPEPSEQRQQLNRLTESSESPGFNNKSINLVLNVPPKNPNGKNANSSAENKPVQKVKKTYI